MMYIVPVNVSLESSFHAKFSGSIKVKNGFKHDFISINVRQVPKGDVK